MKQTHQLSLIFFKCVRAGDFYRCFSIMLTTKSSCFQKKSCLNDIAECGIFKTLHYIRNLNYLNIKQLIFDFLPHFRLLTEHQCIATEVICQESCSSRLVTLSHQNTKGMTTGTPATVAVRLSVLSRPSARHLSCSPSSSSKHQLCAEHCVTLNQKK